LIVSRAVAHSEDPTWQIRILKFYSYHSRVVRIWGPPSFSSKEIIEFFHQVRNFRGGFFLDLNVSGVIAHSDTSISLLLTLKITIEIQV